MQKNKTTNSLLYKQKKKKNESTRIINRNKRQALNYRILTLDRQIHNVFSLDMCGLRQTLTVIFDSDLTIQKGPIYEVKMNRV